MAIICGGLSFRSIPACRGPLMRYRLSHPVLPSSSTSSHHHPVSLWQRSSHQRYRIWDSRFGCYGRDISVADNAVTGVAEGCQ